MMKYAVIVIFGVGVLVTSTIIYFKLNSSQQNTSTPTHESRANQPEERQNGEEEDSESESDRGENANLGGPQEDDTEEEEQEHHDDIVIENHPQPASSSSSNQNIVSSSSMSSIMEQALPEGIVIIIALQNGAEYSFTDWSQASTKLDELASAYDVRLRIEFPSEIILRHHDEESFRAWLARVGDYIFAQRILLIKDVAEVVYDVDLMRVKSHDVHVRGCALFLPGLDRWGVQIRGFETHPTELKMVVEQILFRALRQPERIAPCQAIRGQKMSALLKSYGKKIDQTQSELLDGLMKYSTLNDLMISKKIEMNLGAYLPLVAFETLPMESFESSVIVEEREKLIQEIYSFIVIENISDLGRTEENVKELWRKCYKWLFFKLRTWTGETDLPNLLWRSLFLSEHQNSKL